MSRKSPAAQASQGADIALYYYTGWAQAKLHYSVNAGAWQDTDFQPVMLGGMLAVCFTYAANSVHSKLSAQPKASVAAWFAG